MATTTTRLALRKPAGADTVNVTTDLDDNYDKLDSVVGFTACTAATRPSSPFQGQAIYETDTGLGYVHNGGSPASANWTRSPFATLYRATAATAPTNIQAGFQWFESDTKRLKVSNGTTTTSGGWELPSVPVVSATNQVPNPYAGQVIFNTADNMLYRYDGSAWVAFSANGGGTAATLHEARYYQSVAQTFTTATDTKIKFDTAVTTCNDVTASGTGNTDFLLNRGGLWRVSTAERFLGNAGAGERHIFILTGSTFVAANRVTSTAVTNVGSVPVTVSTSTDLRVTAGTTIVVGGWQNCGANLNSDVGFGQTNHVALTWLRP